jgi:hypothetical protein
MPGNDRRVRRRWKRAWTLVPQRRIHPRSGTTCRTIPRRKTCGSSSATPENTARRNAERIRRRNHAFSTCPISRKIPLGRCRRGIRFFGFVTCGCGAACGPRELIISSTIANRIPDPAANVNPGIDADRNRLQQRLRRARFKARTLPVC